MKFDQLVYIDYHNQRLISVEERKTMAWMGKIDCIDGIQANLKIVGLTIYFSQYPSLYESVTLIPNDPIVSCVVVM